MVVARKSIAKTSMNLLLSSGIKGYVVMMLTLTRDDEAAGLAARGLEIIRVLLAVVDHPTTHLLEDWIPVVKATTSLKSPSSSSPAIIIEVSVSSDSWIYLALTIPASEADSYRIS